MALKIIEFFGHKPLDPTVVPYVSKKLCPFINDNCIKPNHGACTVQQISGDPVLCCPNRLYANNYAILKDIADSVFGNDSVLIKPTEIDALKTAGKLDGSQVSVFGRYWGQELPLPRPKGKGSSEVSNYFVDWILARIDKDGKLSEFTAVEVQTIDTTGNYTDQAQSFFSGTPFTDLQGRTPGYSNSGMNWENVNKRILPQLIYKGHVLRREAKCSKGLFFVCPKQVLEKIKDRLGGTMHAYHPGNGTITFRSYELGPDKPTGQVRDLVFSGQFTTTVDQVALAFTSPMNLPDMNVYENAITVGISGKSLSSDQ